MSYRKNLFRIFFICSVVFTIVVAGISGYFMVTRGAQRYKNSVMLAHSSTENNTQFSTNVILKSLSEIMADQSITDWMGADSWKEFYYQAIGVRQCINNKTTSLAPIQFWVGIMLQTQTQDGPLELVVTGDSTMSAAHFYQRCGMDQNQIREIGEHFEQNISPYCVPQYEEEVLKDVYYIVKDIRKDEECLYFVKLPVETLTGRKNGGDFILYQHKQAIAYSSLDQNKMEYLQKAQAEIAEDGQDWTEQELMLLDGYYMVRSANALLDFEIYYFYPSYSLGALNVLGFVLLVCSLFVLSLYILYRVLEKIYRPVRELVEEFGMDDGQERSQDEFGVIRSNITKMYLLNSELLQLQEENSQLLSQEITKNLLLFPDYHLEGEIELPETGNYCVALVKFGSEQDEDNLQLHYYSKYKSILFEVCMETSEYTYIEMGLKNCCVIIRGMDEQRARKAVQRLASRLNPEGAAGPEIKVQILLSAVRQGTSRLYESYQETQKISEYAHLLPNAEVLTYTDISDRDAHSYSYSMASENRLIQCTLEGKEEALEIFDQLIRLNLKEKNLTIEVMQNFIYALIGTVHRVFQELKDTPQGFLGRSIDFQSWYLAWNDPGIIRQIRDILQEVGSLVRRRSQNSDQELLQKMLSYVYENYSDDIMLNDMAEYLNISPKYCGILFKQLSDNNFKDFLNRYRVEKAKKLLQQQEEIKIIDLCRMVGFNSSNTFIRVFSKYTGLTPKAYSQRIRERLP